MDDLEMGVVRGGERVGEQQFGRDERRAVRQQRDLLDGVWRAPAEDDAVTVCVLDDLLQVVGDETQAPGVGGEGVGDHVDAVVGRVLDDRLRNVAGADPAV